MKDLLNIKYWLFDLDNTLYDGATKVFDQVDKKMTKFISEKLNVKMSDVYALTLGSHGETMVPVPSLCTVSGEPLVNILSKDDIDFIHRLAKKIHNSGKEILKIIEVILLF